MVKSNCINMSITLAQLYHLETIWQVFWILHYNDVIMTTMVSQIINLTIVYSTVYSGTDERKHQNSASLTFVRGIHRVPVNSPNKRPATQKMFQFYDVIMSTWTLIVVSLCKARGGRLHDENFRYQGYSKVLPKWCWKGCLLNIMLLKCSLLPIPYMAVPCRIIGYRKEVTCNCTLNQKSM